MEMWWLLALLFIWGTLLVGGFIFGKEHADNTRRMSTVTRIASSLTLVVGAWSWLIIVQNTELSQLATFIAIGMTFGFFGDVFMAQLIIRNDNYILCGIGAFGVGHIAYIIGLINYGGIHNLDHTGQRWGALIVWLTIATIAWQVVVWRKSERSILHIAALLYSLLLAATTGFATGLALQSSEFILMAMGAVLFLLSDLILAAQLFNNFHFRLISDIVWLTYGPGQMMIVFALALRSIF
jgi:hypothetical protein